MADVRLIDANEIVKVAEHAYNEWNLAMAAADGKREINKTYKMQELCKAVKAVADNCPTIDAVPVVRCRHCRSHHWEQEPCHGKTVHYCKKLGAEVTADFFCAAGKRKDGDGK